MTGGAGTVEVVSAPGGATWRALLPRWRRLTREEIAAACLLDGVLIGLNLIMFTRRIDLYHLFTHFPAGFVVGLVGCVVLLFGIVAADDIPNAVARRIVLALAVVVSGLANAAVDALHDLVGEAGDIGIYLLLLGLVIARSVKSARARWSVLVPAIVCAAIVFGMGWRDLLDDPDRAMALDHHFRVARFAFYQWLLLAGAATFTYLDWRRTRTARARTHAAQVDRARSAKRALESRLQAMQARVEPQFLFNTLAQVKALHRIDPARGQDMLDELIAYLRAAMPKMRDTSSTAGQEIELARAYLAIVCLRLDGRLSCEVETPDPQVAEARMPPMMLLPLIDEAVSHRFAGADAVGHLQVRAELTAATVRLEVRDHGSALPAHDAGPAIDGIRERLAALYGEAATLDLHVAGDGATTAAMQIPLEARAG